MRHSIGTTLFSPLRPVRAAVCYLSITACLTSCSATHSSTSESVPLPPAALTDSHQCIPLTEAGSAQVYRCSDTAVDGPLFVTVLRDCSISEKFSHRATTRQLLVGFTSLKVLNQEPIEVGTEKVLRSVVSGILDVDPVYISTFTLRKGSCVTDLVMWKQSDEAKNATTGTLGTNTIAHRFADSATHLAQRFGEQDIFPTQPLGAGDAPPAQSSSESVITGIPEKVHHAELPTG